MEKGEFASAWPLIRDRVKARWGKRTNQELDGVHENPELLIGMIQEKYDAIIGSKPNYPPRLGSKR